MFKELQMNKKNYHLAVLEIAAVFMLFCYSLTPEAKTLHLEIPRIVTIHTK